MIDRHHVEQQIVRALLEESCTPEELFKKIDVTENDGRDALSALVDRGRVRVGSGWKLRLEYIE